MGREHAGRKVPALLEHSGQRDNFFNPFYPTDLSFLWLKGYLGQGNES